MEDQQGRIDRGKAHHRLIRESADDDLPTTCCAVSQRIAVVQRRIENGIGVGGIATSPQPLVVDRQRLHVKRPDDVGRQRGAVPHVEEATVCDVDYICRGITELHERGRD